jgi:hypothetical protein
MIFPENRFPLFGVMRDVGEIGLDVASGTSKSKRKAAAGKALERLLVEFPDRAGPRKPDLNGSMPAFAS